MPQLPIFPILAFRSMIQESWGQGHDLTHLRNPRTSVSTSSAKVDQQMIKKEADGGRRGKEKKRGGSREQGREAQFQR